jgi:proteasome lid subunit RPN8/RPN11
VLGKGSDPNTHLVRRCANLANQHHQEDPVRFPRDARTAYVMDPQDLLRIQREADTKGLDFLVIYHSHTDHEAYFSKTDKELALFDGEPMWPHARYMVISVKDHNVSYFKVFRWDSLLNDFIDEPSSVLKASR